MSFRKRPNLIIYLEVSPQTSLQRICERYTLHPEREMEKGISLEYLTKLRDGYEIFIQEISRLIPVIKGNCDHVCCAKIGPSALGRVPRSRKSGIKDQKRIRENANDRDFRCKLSLC